MDESLWHSSHDDADVRAAAIKLVDATYEHEVTSFDPKTLEITPGVCISPYWLNLSHVNGNRPSDYIRAYEEIMEARRH